MIEQPKALLVISTENHISDLARSHLVDAIGPVARELGMLVAVMDGGLKAQVHRDLSPLVEALQAQTHAVGQLIQQNAALIQAMAEQEQEQDAGEPVGYLSSKKR